MEKYIKDETEKITEQLKYSLSIYFKNLYDKKVDVSYEKIKQETGIGKSTVSDFFNQDSLPNIETIVKFAIFFNANLNDIFVTEILPPMAIGKEPIKDVDYQIQIMLQNLYNFNDVEIKDIQTYINYVKKAHNK